MIKTHQTSSISGMKKISIAFICLFFSTQFMSAELSKSQWEQGIAILSKQVNILSLEEMKNNSSAKSAVAGLKKLTVPFTVKQVESNVQSFPANKKDLCGELNRKLVAKYTTSQDINSAILYFSKTVFSNELNAFINKSPARKSKLPALEQKIKNELTAYFKTIENTIPQSQEETSEFVTPPHNGSAVVLTTVPDETAAVENAPVESKGKSNTLDVVLLIFRILIFIILIGIIYLIIRRLMEQSQLLLKVKKKLKELDDSSKAMTNELTKMEARIKDLQTDIKYLERTYEEGQEPEFIISRTQAEKKSPTQTSTPIQDEPIADEKTEPLMTVVQEQEEGTAHVLYLSTPTADGYFSPGSKEYHEGVSIYILKTYNNLNGTFSVIQNQEAYATVLTDIDMFLIPACSIKGKFPENEIDAILTESEGIVEKEDGLWKIKEKALIRFE